MAGADEERSGAQRDKGKQMGDEASELVKDQSDAPVESETGKSAAAELDKEKLDSVIAQISGGADLSQDNVPSTADDNIALQESVHRRKLQTHLFYWGMAFVGILFLAAIIFGGVIVCRYWRTPGNGAVDWHVSAITAAFVIPPTVVLIALIRSVYDKAESKSTTDSLPALNLIKDILIAVKEAAKAVK